MLSLLIPLLMSMAAQLDPADLPEAAARADHPSPGSTPGSDPLIHAQPSPAEAPRSPRPEAAVAPSPGIQLPAQAAALPDSTPRPETTPGATAIDQGSQPPPTSTAPSVGAPLAPQLDVVPAAPIAPTPVPPAPLVCPAPVPAASLQPAAEKKDDKIYGPFIGIGYGIHRYITNTLSMDQRSSDRRSLFDGTYTQVQPGYLAHWGGFVGLDWVHHSGKNTLQTHAGALSLKLRSDFVSLAMGIEVGNFFRFHAALLTGVAIIDFSRTLQFGDTEEKLAKELFVPLVGTELGLNLLPLSWLSVGVRLRADFTLFDDAADGSGGFYLGLSAAYVFDL